MKCLFFPSSIQQNTSYIEHADPKITMFTSNCLLLNLQASFIIIECFRQPIHLLQNASHITETRGIRYLLIEFLLDFHAFLIVMIGMFKFPKFFVGQANIGKIHGILIRFFVLDFFIYLQTLIKILYSLMSFAFFHIHNTNIGKDISFVYIFLRFVFLNYFVAFKQIIECLFKLIEFLQSNPNFFQAQSIFSMLLSKHFFSNFSTFFVVL